MLLLSSADFFQNLIFQKTISGALPECQTIWVETVCNGREFFAILGRGRRAILIGKISAINPKLVIVHNYGIFGHFFLKIYFFIIRDKKTTKFHWEPGRTQKIP